MPDKTMISNMLIRSSLIMTFFSFTLTFVLGSLVSSGWWMISMIPGVFSVATLFQQLKARRQDRKVRQSLMQSYVEQLLLARTPDERQPIIEAMSAQGLLKGIRLSSLDLEDLDLSFADMTDADLSGASLSGSNLTGINLTGATLSYATLSYTTLFGANLRGANLRGVNLHASDLRQADLTDAFMRGACLVDTALNGAVLHRTQLHEANLQEADLSDARLEGADFTRAILPYNMSDRATQFSAEWPSVSQQF